MRLFKSPQNTNESWFHNDIYGLSKFNFIIFSGVT